MITILDLNRRLFARYYDRVAARYEEAMGPRKRKLFSSLYGTVVELGPGTGANLSLLPRGLNWIGIEPNPHMHPRLRAKAEKLGLDVDLRLLGAQGLSLDDASVDAVISTLVLCSVPDPDAVMKEVLRVLKPGGRFVFWEHVAAPPGTRLRAAQHLMTPLHRCLGDGCRANRDLAAVIRRAGYQEVQMEEFRVPKGVLPPWVRPHLRGTATRAGI